MTAPAADWDMTPYFAAPDGDPLGAPYREFRAAVESDVAEVGAEARRLGPIASDVAGWVALLRRLEDLSTRLRHMGSYLGCLGAADGDNEAIQLEDGALSRLGAEVAKAFVPIEAALKACDDATFQQLETSPELAPVAHYLRRARIDATFTMAPAQEELAADLSVTGMDAWGRLYDQLSGKLTFRHAPPGTEARTLPVSLARSLMEDADPAVRTAAFEGSARAWESVADTVAACLNSISGTRLTLYRRSGVDHFLEPALRSASIERGTLDAMLDAVMARQEVPRRYLRRKAARMGKARLKWQDLEAPLPPSAAAGVASEGEARMTWDAARARVLETFGDFYPALGDFARQAFDDRWIDHSPRSGKRPGGFCSSSSRIGQSRIFMTFHGAPGDVQTLAHELGHAYHSHLLKEMRPWAQRYPMTLAETASTFAENLVTDAVLRDPRAPTARKLAVLDTRLMDSAAFLLNIPTRFTFEKAVYEEREAGELSVSRLKALMTREQRRHYGDALEEDGLDPWFWASKLHFYITGVSFYNFPYTFGYLLSLGLFARAKAEGPGFLAQYEEFLRLTGSDTAEGVARRALGVDLTKPDFWNASIDLIEADLNAFEELV